MVSWSCKWFRHRLYDRQGCGSYLKRRLLLAWLRNKISWFYIFVPHRSIALHWSALEWGILFYSTFDRITSGEVPIRVMAEILWPPLTICSKMEQKSNALFAKTIKHVLLDSLSYIQLFFAYHYMNIHIVTTSSISPLQRPHYFTSSYTYLFLKKNILLSFLGWRIA